MTPPATAQFRTLSFGDPEGRLWCGALDAGGLAAMVFGSAGATGSASGPGAVGWSLRDGGWSLSGDAFEVFVAPETDLGAEPPAGGTELVSHELCRVRGTITAGGAEHAVDCTGTRSFSDGIDVRRLGSVRGVSGWFGDRDALTLLAFRPAGSASHEDDVVVATLFEPDRRLAVDEPRLSTTYDAAGAPARTSLELWIGEGEQQFPRRAAAEAVGAGAQAETGALALRVTPLRCHARGLDGGGVYLLARF